MLKSYDFSVILFARTAEGDITCRKTNITAWQYNSLNPYGFNGYCWFF